MICLGNEFLNELVSTTQIAFKFQKNLNEKLSQVKFPLICKSNKLIVKDNERFIALLVFDAN